MEVRKTKTAKQLERHFKGVVNHRRLEILMLVADEEGITLEDIADRVRGNFKTISEHVRRLAQAGLVQKSYRGRNVAHALTPYGKTFIHFIRTLSHS